MRVRELRAKVRTIAATAAFGAAFVFGSAILVFSKGMAQSNPLPERVRQPTPAKVVAEHMAAFNACDWKRLMAQFPDNVEFFAPNGVTVRGRKAVGESTLLSWATCSMFSGGPMHRFSRSLTAEPMPTRRKMG
jgi:hypothetical protein